MKTKIKILILLLSFLGVLALILVFMFSILKPPTKANCSNQFYANMDDFIDDFKGEKNMSLDELENVYLVFVELLKIYNDNALLSSTEKSSETDKFASAYNPLFANACLDYFSNSCWDGDDLAMMNNRLAQLKKLSQKEYGNVQKIKTVSQVLIDYNKASELSKKNWKSLVESEKNRTKTEKYKKDEYLRNNTCLCKQLEEAMHRQGQQHYNNLYNQVVNLNSYQKYKDRQSEYEKMSTKTMNNIDEYAKNAERVYGKLIQVNTLREDATVYDYQATECFKIYNSN